jgi:hypothetical protein
MKFIKGHLDIQHRLLIVTSQVFHEPGFNKLIPPNTDAMMHENCIEKK